MNEFLVISALCIIGPPLALFLLGLAIAVLMAITDRLAGL